jgi:hypothetical protein
MASLFVGLFLVPRGTIMHAQEHRQRVSLTTDWSHRHMVYSKARSPMQALSLERDPRYLQQWYRRNAALNNSSRRGGRGNPGNPGEPEQNESAMTRDWSELLGTNTSVATVGEDDFPAKFSFDVDDANCDTATQPDYVVYNTSVAPQATQTTAVSTDHFTATPGATNTTTVGATTYTWHSTTGNCTGTPCIIEGASATQAAANFRAAIDNNSAQCGSTAPCFLNLPGANASVTATVLTTTTTLTSKTVGATGNFTFTTTDGTSETLATVTTGANVQASIVAYDNLYSGCSGTKPHIYWAYNTGGTISTSPILSLDGSQVAFIHTPASGGASLVILKWKSAEGATYNATTTAAATPGSSTATPATYVSCKSGATSCQLTLAFANATNDSNSSPFYDYNTDVLFVGDDTGHIHKFTGVFKGTPTEVNNPWVTLTHASITDVATGPIFEGGSGRIFVGDHAGYLYNISCTLSGNPALCTTAGVLATVTPSTNLSAGGNGIFDSPVVDGTAGQVYVFASHNVGIGAANRSQVSQFPITFASGNSATSNTVVSNSSTEATSLFAGDFDNVYYSSDFGSTGGNQPSGNMYVCGVVTGVPNLYQIPITANAMGTAVVVRPLASVATPCGPITEATSQNALGGTEDWIYMDVEASSTQNGTYGCAAGGCVMNLSVTQWTPSSSFVIGQHITDSNGDIEIVTTGGTSKSGAHPIWATAGGTTADGGISWFNQGLALSFTSWTASTVFAANAIILDQNNFIQEVTSAGVTPHRSGITIPTWGAETTGLTTTDGNLTWTNRGAAGFSTIAAAGGSSGFIIDNFVPAGTLAGASQIYFTPLASSTCTTSGGTGGCAVQASQAALH